MHLGNSSKDYRLQSRVAADVASQLRRGEKGIIGVMIESNLEDGRQDISRDGPASLRRGVSITDGCIGWEATVKVLNELADAIRTRRAFKLRD